MSYLGTLVNTPSAASAPRLAGPALEQHVEMESPASVPLRATSEHVKPAPQQQRSIAQAPHTEPTASVEDALRAAFEWVSPQPVTPTITAETEQATSTRSAALELRAQSVAAPVEASQTIDTPQTPRPLERHERTLAVPAFPQAVERIDTKSASTEIVELTTFESMPVRTLEAKPRRRAVSAQHTAPAEAQAPPRPSPVQVRIGTISLNVRTPSPPAPAPKAAAPVPAPAAERPAPSAPFAFSARRHHLRWG